MKKINFRGFTLIELLVVVMVIGVLATLLMTNYVAVRARSRDAERKADLRQIQSALELYRSDIGTYPGSLPNCGNSLTGGGVTYMQKIPCDPENTDYYYSGAYSNTAYTLAACLENVNDQQKDSPSNPTQIDGSASLTSCLSYTLFSP